MSFYKARDFSIGTATFNANTFSGGTHIHYHGQAMGSDPMKILSDARAVEATHTSKAASYAPKCKPGSRALIIQDVTDWITSGGAGKEAGAPTMSILWFQGPAGGGKTCIMREVVARCVKLGILAASYFFSSRIPRLDNEEPFIATILYQLAAKSPALKAEVLRTISDEPDIFQESLDAQMERLLLDPLNSVESPFPLRPNAGSQKRVIVIDGFDECRDPKERTHLLEILFTIATSTPHFLVVVASRPEFDIRTAFTSQPFAPITQILRLEDYDGTSDIRTFYCDEFCRIRGSHPARAAIPNDWPCEDYIAILVNNSSGSFIYPSTVVKHVDNPRRNPVLLLEEVIRLMTNQHSGSIHLSDLDTLYTHILHPPGTDAVLLKRLLHCIMDSMTPSPPSFFDQLLSLPPGTTEMTLCDLHSVVKLPAPGTTDSVAFHHKSMRDYLKSPQRAGDLYQPFYLTNLDLATACMVHLRNIPSTSTQKDVHYYSAFNWPLHVQQAFEDAPGLALELLPESIKNFDPLPAWKYRFMGYHITPSFWPQQAIHNSIVRVVCPPASSSSYFKACVQLN